MNNTSSNLRRWTLTAVGIVIALIGVVMRIAKIGRVGHLNGFMYTFSYPAAMWTFVIGLAIAVIGVIVAIVHWSVKT